jgi:hypothetical protein
MRVFGSDQSLVKATETPCEPFGIEAQATLRIDSANSFATFDSEFIR